MSSDNQKGEFLVIDPVGKVLMTDQPTFRWSPMEGATGYVVEVYDSKFKLEPPARSSLTNSWTIRNTSRRGKSIRGK